MSPAAEGVFVQGIEALNAENLAAAERLFAEIVAREPRAHEAWNALSVVAIRSGSPDIAVAHARHANELDRRNPLYLNNLGVALGELGEFHDAEMTLRRALKIKPVYAEGLFNLGKTLHKQGRLADSLAAFQRAYAMDSEFPGLRVSLAFLHRVSGQPDRVIEVLQEKPGGIDQISAPLYAECVAALHGAEAALAWMQEILLRHPSWTRLQFASGLLLLSRGQWRQGWSGYRLRGDESVAAGRTPLLPSSLAGRKVLLRGDQGLGDVLFFLRFVPELQERGAKVYLHCSAPLCPLLASTRVLEAVFDPGHAVDDAAFDASLLIGDLPAALDTASTPPPLPLQADCSRVEQLSSRLRALGPPPYLGLTWRAGTDTLRDREFGNPQSVLSKEVPLRRLAAAVRGWPGTLLCLQRNPYPGEIEAVSAATGAPVHDFSQANGDLREMLALLSLLDEYVTVSNTNVHLLASLGKRAKVIVPYPPEWRWMFEGDESPWFPGFAVYRQPVSRDWSEPLARLKGDLSR